MSSHPAQSSVSSNASPVTAEVPATKRPSLVQVTPGCDPSSEATRCASGRRRPSRKESGGTSVLSSQRGGTAERMRALSIRQPAAEAIMRGAKDVEYRKRSTNIRGRIYIYASLGRSDPAEEEGDLKRWKMTDASLEDLPRGVIVGTVELYDSEGGEWYLRNPVRAERLRKPKKRPQPIWFYPF